MKGDQMMRRFEGYQKGINLGGWISQCKNTKEHYDSFIKEKDIALLATWGIDHVRVPVDYELVETEEGSYKEEGFTYIDSCIAWCRKYHLNMILDLHKTAGYSFDEQESEDAFFEKVELQDRFVSLWREFTRRYAEHGDILAFELLNEVVNPNVSEKWNAIVRRTIEAIRETAPDIHILVGGVCNNSVTKVKLLDSPYDENIVYNFHCYDPLIFTHQSASWVPGMPADFHLDYPGDIEKYKEHGKIIDPAHSESLYVDGIYKLGAEFFETIFKEAIEAAEKNNAMLYCGEYGVIGQAPIESTLNWYRDVHAVFEKYGIGRAAWNYKRMKFGLVDENYDSVREQLISLL